MDFLPHPSEPLSKKLRLTLERPPPPIDPITGQPQVLYDYSPEGTPIWRPFVSTPFPFLLSLYPLPFASDPTHYIAL
jgi:hypothetical protein